jgi:putative CocE/NonD family hydrolase
VRPSAYHLNRVTELSAPTHEIRMLYDLKACMRDDVRLSNDVFLPRQPGRYPTILLRTPYETLHEPHIEWAVWWAKRGYAVVIQDCRGRFESEGSFYPYRDDGPDGHDIDVQTIGRQVPWYRDWCAHTTYDDYWKALDTERTLDQVNVPVVQQAAWYDPYTASMLRTWGKLSQRRPDQRIYVIPWTHHLPEGSKLGDLDFGPGAYVDLKHEDLRWFDYWLKGNDTGIMAEPPIKLFVMGDNVWRYEHEWPLARTQFTRYFLHSQGSANSLAGSGTLMPEPPGTEPPDRYDYDPDHPVPTLGGNNSTWTWMKFAAEPVYTGPIDQRPLERRDDVLVYTSPRLDHELEVTGPLEMVLYAASSARDTDFTAKLVDVYPDGRAIHVSEGILRGRHRASLETVDFLEPGEVAEFRIQLAPTSNVFGAGHRLRVEISSSNFPRFDRNLNTGDDIFTSTRMQVARQTVLHEQRYPSHLIVPVIPR